MEIAHKMDEKTEVLGLDESGRERKRLLDRRRKDEWNGEIRLFWREDSLPPHGVEERTRDEREGLKRTVRCFISIMCQSQVSLNSG